MRSSPGLRFRLSTLLAMTLAAGALLSLNLRVGHDGSTPGLYPDGHEIKGWPFEYYRGIPNLEYFTSFGLDPEMFYTFTWEYAVANALIGLALVAICGVVCEVLARRKRSLLNTTAA